MSRNALDVIRIFQHASRVLTSLASKTILSRTQQFVSIPEFECILEGTTEGRGGERCWEWLNEAKSVDVL